ncbi:MAG: hypothetical protein ABIN18_15465 [Pseudomonadota bacterium]
MKAKITLTALLGICATRLLAVLGTRSLSSPYSAMAFFDRAPDLKFERIYVERVRVWKGLKESKERSSVFYY